MKPFLLVSTRPEEEALDSEYQAYLHASGLARHELELAEFDLLGLPPLDPAQYSGVFIAGSPYGAGSTDGYISQTQQRVRSELQDLFAQLLEAETPLLATGTAMTILAELLGASVSPDNAELAEVIEVEKVREAADDPITATLPSIFHAYTNHGEAIDELPEGAVRLARSLDTPFQIVRFNDQVYATQFNPELDGAAIYSQAVAFEDAGDTGFGDVEALVAAGRHTEGHHKSGQILANFVENFRA